MSTNLKPPKGMRDFLPEEKALREQILYVIRDEYRKNGFTEIETSSIENIGKLENSDGGDNTKLIFKILKRGEKLDLNTLKENELADLGLRFDLTLPLSRFYANNKNELPLIFKAVQIGNVFRAERPQKGRYRSFVQCDVDVIGDPSNIAEIELINTVTKALARLGLNDFVVKINDRRVLKGLVTYSGFSEDAFTDIVITLDKLDKIGKEGVSKELIEKGYESDNVDTLLKVSEEIASKGLEALKEFNLSPEGYENLKEIITVIDAISDGYSIEFDFSLARGMGYYTSTIFEVAYSDVGYSVAGGGRYDEMIGKLSGTEAPAVGFSIGFERIADILREKGSSFEVPKKLALLVGADDSRKDVFIKVNGLKTEYDIVTVFETKKKLGKQLKRLQSEGFNFFAQYAEELEIKSLD